MSSLVLELQQDALNPSVSLSNLVRKDLFACKWLRARDLNQRPRRTLR
jgi:hypothetical protein